MEEIASVEYFWHYRPLDHFPPPTIRLPQDRRDGDRLCLKCTQTNLPAKQQRALVSQWCDELPRLSGVRWLWLNSRVPQSLFDAACSMPNLEGLWVKWMAGESLAALTRARSLRYLHLGNCSSVCSLEPLREMKELLWLGVEHFPKVRSVAPLADITKLIGLTIEGSILKAQRIQSIEPLRGMAKLRYLSLANVRAADGSLDSLMGMKELETLILPKWWDESEVASIRRRHPRLEM